MKYFNNLSSRGTFNKVWEKDVLVIVETKNAEFTSHKDIWQNFQDKEETNKTNPVTAEASPKQIEGNSGKGRFRPPTQKFTLKRRETKHVH